MHYVFYGMCRTLQMAEVMKANLYRSRSRELGFKALFCKKHRRSANYKPNQLRTLRWLNFFWEKMSFSSLFSKEHYGPLHYEQPY